ncbi:MAG TPA: AI-2E family transporter [Thermomicrobiales bacterium]|nr:AI-2E family transporter [Thermomicrobiales bacterium]
MSARQTAINTVVILLVLLAAWVIVQVRSILVLLVVGILFAAAIEPMVNWLRRRGMRRGQAIGLIYLTVLASLAILAVLFLPAAIRQVSDLIDNIPDIIVSSRSRAQGIQNEAIREALVKGINEIDRRYQGLADGQDTSFSANAVFGLISSIGGGVVTVVTVFVVAFYWLTEKSTIKQVTLRKLPADQRVRAFAVWEEIERRIGGWTRGQFTLCLIIGILSTVAYGLIGVKYFVALGIFAGITELIPFIGPILGGTAAAIVALTDSWQRALIVVVFVIILQQVESALLVPRVMRNAVGMSPLTVILAVLAGSTLYGPLGAILAIPLGAAVQAMIQEFVRDQSEPEVPVTQGAPPGSG